MKPESAMSGRAGKNAENVPDAPVRLALYERMLLIRGVEECLVRNFKDGVLPRNVHLYVGEEAIAAGVCAHLTDNDWITSTHRGHGHFLAKGGEPEALFAEIYGRSAGVCKGFGGTMHVADFAKGIVGANGIVAAGIPIATGAALAAQMDGDSHVAVAFFGDGASNRGVLMESLNIATLWRLPIVFVCENNGFSEFSPTETVTAGAIHARASAFGIPSESIDGNAVELVWQTAGAAVARARKGEGPSFIEARTYRLRGHNESETYWLSEPYRTEEDVARWRERDPLPRYARQLQRDGVADATRLAAIEAEVAARVEHASQAALRSAPASPELLQTFLAKNGSASTAGTENA